MEELHDWIVLIIVCALVVYTVGRLLIAAFFSAKRKHTRNALNDILGKEEIS